MMSLPAVESEPGVVQIEVTSRCNLDCRLCPHAGLDEMQDMDVDLFRRIIDQFCGKPHEIYLCGLGEPLMHPRLDDLIRHCWSRGLTATVIHTNGTMLTPQRADALAAAGLSEIRLSIDGGDAATLARARPGVRLPLMIARMRHVTTHTPMAASLYFTANLENLHSLPSLVGVAVDMGVKRIHVVDTVPFGTGGADAAWATRTRKMAMVEDGQKQAAFDEFRRRCAEAGIEGRESLESFRSTCHDPFTKIYVTWKGEITPCCRIHTQVVVGDLRTTALPLAWHGRDLEAWRAQLWSGRPHELCRRLCNLPAAPDALSA